MIVYSAGSQRTLLSLHLLCTQQEDRCWCLRLATAQSQRPAFAPLPMATASMAFTYAYVNMPPHSHICAISLYHLSAPMPLHSYRRTTHLLSLSWVVSLTVYPTISNIAIFSMLSSCYSLRHGGLRTKLWIYLTACADRVCPTHKAIHANTILALHSKSSSFTLLYCHHTEAMSNIIGFNHYPCFLPTLPPME